VNHHTSPKIEKHEETLLLDAKQLSPRLSMTVAQVLRLQRQGRIPAIRLGHRTLRFNISAVMAALGK
jgi:predicted DNA-binding transcriptional regulator AlpA